LSAEIHTDPESCRYHRARCLRHIYTVPCRGISKGKALRTAHPGDSLILLRPPGKRDLKFPHLYLLKRDGRQSKSPSFFGWCGGCDCLARGKEAAPFVIQNAGLNHVLRPPRKAQWPLLLPAEARALSRDRGLKNAASIEMYRQLGLIFSITFHCRRQGKRASIWKRQALFSSYQLTHS